MLAGAAVAGPAGTAALNVTAGFTGTLHMRGCPPPVRRRRAHRRAPAHLVAVRRRRNPGGHPATAEVTAGTAVPLALNWQGLAPADEHLGALLLDDGTIPISRTPVTIDTR